MDRHQAPRKPIALPIRILAGVGAALALAFGLILPYILFRPERQLRYRLATGDEHVYQLSTSVTMDGRSAEVTRVLRLHVLRGENEQEPAECRIDIECQDPGETLPEWASPEALSQDSASIRFRLSSSGTQSVPTEPTSLLWSVLPQHVFPLLPSRAGVIEGAEGAPAGPLRLALPGIAGESEQQVEATWSEQAHRLGTEVRGGAKCVRISRTWRVDAGADGHIAATGQGTTWFDRAAGSVIMTESSVKGAFVAGGKTHLFTREDELVLLPRERSGVGVLRKKGGHLSVGDLHQFVKAFV